MDRDARKGAVYVQEHDTPGWSIGKAITAIARVLHGFNWAIAVHVEKQQAVCNQHKVAVYDPDISCVTASTLCDYIRGTSVRGTVTATAMVSPAGLRVSACVTAHNEERNIRKLLRSLLEQKILPHELCEVVVVASGCTDGTTAEVLDLAHGDARLRLLVQDARLGKASAINAYGRERDPAVDAVAIVSADLILQPGCLQLLLDRLASSPHIGMTGPRPVPTNPRGSLMGNMVGFLWQLHHDISNESPKLGEVIVLKSLLVRPIPEDCPVDEATLEAGVIKQGFSLSYVPEAVVANRGPSNVREYFDQRRRIAAGHFWLRRRTGYSVPTLSVKRITKHAVRYLTFSDPGTDASYMAAALLEGAARVLGYFDYKREYNHAIWKVAHSTRDVTPVEKSR
jgi:glycosyltransferase involved in cell wall biosynthesis